MDPAVALPTDRILDFEPGMAMRWEITRSSAETGGELLETVNWLGPGADGGPPVHVHAAVEESYEVLEGAIDVFIGGEWHTLATGARVVVRPGTAHTLKRSGEGPARIINTHRPALRFEQMFREMCGLIRSGRIRGLAARDPRSLLYGAMLFTKYSDLQKATSPPQALLVGLARLGKVLGLRLES
ncbi:MAG: cupin domain-containing protein [Acetobacteraceae bacterium]|nr:cupin domain-containing protein [Acetobacteraceae bacterium]